MPSYIHSEIVWPLYTPSELLQVVRFRTRCIPSDKRGSFLECERCQFQFFISFGKPRPSSFFQSIHSVDIHIGYYLILPKVWQKMSEELWLQLNEYETDPHFLQISQFRHSVASWYLCSYLFWAENCLFLIFKTIFYSKGKAQKSINKHTLIFGLIEDNMELFHIY